MKLKPWFSSRIAKPATSHTQSSLQTCQSKPAQAGRAVFPHSSPMTAQAGKILLANAPRRSLPMLFRSRARSLPTSRRSEPPRGSAAATGLCLLGKQVWTSLALPEEMRAVIKRERRKTGSGMRSRTEGQPWEETSRAVPVRES